MGLTGRLSAGLFPLIKRLVSMTCYSTVRSMFEKNLQIVSTQATQKESTTERSDGFVYERDALPHIIWLVEESGLAAKAGS